ncbi:MAG: helix-turn-helix domain-containing protein [Thermodesulfovibrionales bacterium]
MTITHQTPLDGGKTADAEKEQDLNPRWLSISQACRYCSMSTETLMKYVRKGDIYGSKKGGKWWVDKLSVDAFFLADKAAVEEALDRVRKSIGQVRRKVA